VRITARVSFAGWPKQPKVMKPLASIGVSPADGAA
jgi:hypothetical protein